MALKRNILANRDWWTRKRLMCEFRTAHLTGGSRAIHRAGALSRVEADVLIVESDQIWNPDITFGLRPAYFGAFENSRIRKTVAYAASLGAASLRKEVEPKFSRLLESTGLTGRMAAQGYAPDIDGEINWTEVDRLLRTHREGSMEFLRRSLTS